MKLNPKLLTRYKRQPSKSHEIRYCCPFCGDLNGKLYANLKKGVWNCFHCGQSGGFAARDIYQIQGEPLRFKEETIKIFKWETHPDVIGNGIRYLKRRNIDNNGL